MKRFISTLLAMLLVFSLCSVALAANAPVVKITSIKNDEYASVKLTLPANSRVTNAMWLLEFDSSVLEFDAENTRAIDSGAVCGISKKYADTCAVAIISDTRYNAETVLAEFRFTVIDAQAESADFTLKTKEVCVSDNTNGSAAYDVTSTAADIPFTVNNCAHDSVEWDEARTIESTCTLKGTKFGSCPDCGKLFEEELALKEHTYVWTVLTHADFENDGSEQGICSVCEDETTRVIPKIPSTMVFFEETGVKYDTENHIVYRVLPNTAALEFISSGVLQSEFVRNRTRNVDAANAGLIGTGSEFYMTSGDTELDVATVVVFADVDGDGKVTTSDARVALRAAAHLDEPLSGACLLAADTTADSNSEIGTSDARQILRIAAKLDLIGDVMAAVYAQS